MVLELLTDAAWWGGHGIATFSPYHWRVCVCAQAFLLVLLSEWHLWSGFMAQRSCRGSWTTWAVSVRMSISPCRPWETATLPSRAHGSLGHAVYYKPTNSNLCLNSRSHHITTLPNNRPSSPPQCPLPQICVSDGACMMSWHASSPFEREGVEEDTLTHLCFW